MQFTTLRNAVIGGGALIAGGVITKGVVDAAQSHGDTQKGAGAASVIGLGAFGLGFAGVAAASWVPAAKGGNAALAAAGLLLLAGAATTITASVVGAVAGSQQLPATGIR